jgi:hypothetical protein
MFAFINPFNVATPSLITGTSRGATVVTRTSGAAGTAEVDLREQARQIQNSDQPAQNLSTLISFVRRVMTVLAPPSSRRKAGAPRKTTRRRFSRMCLGTEARRPSTVAYHHRLLRDVPDSKLRRWLDQASM